MRPFRLRNLLVAVLLLSAATSVQAALVNLEATELYDSQPSCVDSSAAPVQVTAQLNWPGWCSANTGCSETKPGASLFSAISCPTTDGTSNGDFIKTILPNLYESTPYVVVESYSTPNCADVFDITLITAYLADGQCHQTDVAASYTATRAADDGSVTVLTYGSTDCSTTPTAELDASGYQTTGTCAVDTDNDGVGDTKIYGTGVTTVNLKATVTFDTNSSACLTSAVVPIQEALLPIFSTSCAVTNGCSGPGPYTSIACTTASSYQSEAAAAFGVKPYVIVESYVAAKSCIGSRLSGATVYLADGLCHETNESASYSATRTADGSVTILTFTAVDCTEPSVTTLDASAAEVTGQSCANDGKGVLDTKIYGFGVTPVYLQSTSSYDSVVGNCSSPVVPTQEVMSVVSSTGCKGTVNGCWGPGPYVSMACSMFSTYQEDVTASFGSNPYVIVESYVSGKSCDGTKLSGVTVYLADSLCHQTGISASYITTRAADGSATVLTYGSSDCSSPTTTALDASGAQVNGQSCVLDSKIYGVGVTPLYLQSTSSFETNVGNCSAPVVLTQEVMSVVSSTSCTPTNGCSGPGPYTSIGCTTASSYQSEAAAALGAKPYVIVEAYVAGKSCIGSRLSGAMVYLADGLCHKTDVSASYTATRTADGSVTVVTYGSSDCSSMVTNELDASAAEVTGQSCVLDAKIYGFGVTPLYLQSTLSFDTNVGNCSSPVVPTQEVMSVVSSTSCIPTNGCSGPGPYTSIGCTMFTTYQDDISEAFGSTPYVIVESYVPGKSCDGTKLSGVTVYLADGLCHQTGGSAYYTATRAADGSVTILAFTAADCTGPSNTMLDASAAEVTGQSCTADGKGVLNMKIYGFGVTPLYLQSTSSFDTNVGNCSSPVVPTQEVMSVVASTDCTEMSVCEGLSLGPYTSIACSVFSTYQADVSKTFGSSPYVIVESYVSSNVCTGTKLAGMTVYSADGLCHKTSATSSYTATRAADGSVTILTFSASGCTGSSMTTLDASAAQVKGQSCASGVDGIANTKIYGFGVTPLYMKATLAFETNVGNCSSPVVPSQEVMRLVSSTDCSPTSFCAGAGPYTSIACSMFSTYQADVSMAFDSKPYIIVESYISGKSCDGTKLSGVTAYLADGLCHQTDISSYYTATRAADGSVTILAFTAADCTGSSVSTLDASAAQVKGQSCGFSVDGIANTKIYGFGVTPLYLKATLKFETNVGNCSSPVVPSQEVMRLVSSTGCTETKVCAGASSGIYTNTQCSMFSTYQADASKTFGSKPYVIMESYATGKSCDGTKLYGVVVFLADGLCHKAGAIASYTAISAADGSVTILAFASVDCTGSSTTTLDASVAEVTGQSCANDGKGVLNMKIYGFGVTPLYLQSTLSFDTNVGNCSSSVVPTQEVMSVVSSTSCTPTNNCSGSSVPFTNIACTTASSYQSETAAAFGAKPYVIVESYVPGKSCIGSRLSGAMVYLADGLCHQTNELASYAATRTADGSVKILTFNAADCTGPSNTMLDASAAEVTGQSCANDGKGVLNMKIYGFGVTPLYLQSTLSFDTNVGNCSSPVVPTQEVLTLVSSTSCTPTNSCSSSSVPFTGIRCSAFSTYQEDVAASFGSNPYVIVEAYASGMSCDVSSLSNVTVYLADGLCHQTEVSASYTATKAADGSVTLLMYESSDCSTAPTIELDASGSQTSGMCPIVTDSDGIGHAKIYGSGTTTVNLKATVSFDTDTGGCVTSAVVPIQEALFTTPTGCMATTVCVGASPGPYTSIACTTASSYQTEAAAAFGANPYVIVESYVAGKSCIGSRLSSAMMYLADGLCHQTNVSSYYMYTATRTADGSVKILTFNAADCTGPSNTMLDASAAEVTGQSCTADGKGVLNMKIYGFGVTPLYLQSTLSFDTNVGNCSSPVVPTQEVLTLVSSTSCTPTNSCSSSSVPFTGIRCSAFSTYQEDVAASFGSNPYVIVEAYASGMSCDVSSLSNVTVYLTDGLCHQTGVSSYYTATRTADGSVVILEFTVADCTGPSTTLLDASAAEVTGQSCANDGKGVLDTKLYGFDVTPLYLQSTLSFDTNVGNCSSPVVPTQEVLTLVSSTSCTPTNSCSSSSVPFTGIRCSAFSTYQEDVAASFGSNPYVIVEAYASGMSCDVSSLSNVTVYLADGLCHQTDVSASYTATRTADGSVVILVFTVADCTGPSTTLLDASAAEVTGQSCVLDAKIYGFGVTPLYLQSTLSFDTNVGNCSSSVLPTQEVMSVVSSTSCTPTNGCSGLGPYTSIACTMFTTYQDDVSKTFGSTPYVIVEAYAFGMSCDVSSLSNVTVYLADGQCHQTDVSASYTVTTATDGSAVIKTFDVGNCAGSAITLDVKAAQANNQSCAADKDGVIDMKVFGSGEILLGNCPSAMNMTTCYEVYETCGYNSSCDVSDGKLSYYCSDLGCNGTWSSSSNSGDVCQPISSSTCEEAHTALISAGCTCSYCSTEESYIAVGCYSPFKCSSDIYTTNDVENKYTVAILVYLIIAASLVVSAIVVSLCCTSTQSQEMTTKDIVRTRLSCLGSGIYRMSLASFVLDDGSPLQFLDYAFDKRDLFGFLDCRNKTVNMRPRWMRLGAFVTTLLVTISLAFIYGIYAYNKERCSYFQQSCTVADITVSCGASGEVIEQAYWTTALLTLVVSKGSALAVNAASVGSTRQKLHLIFTFIVAVGLLIYAVKLSNGPSKAEFEDHRGSSHRLTNIGFTLLAGWGFAEIVGIVLVILRFLTCRICYSLTFWPQLKEVKKYAGAATVHPQKGSTGVDDIIMELGGKLATITVVSPADSDDKSMDSVAVGETTEPPISASITNKTMSSDENTESGAKPATISVGNSTDHTKETIGRGPESAAMPATISVDNSTAHSGPGSGAKPGTISFDNWWEACNVS